MLVNGVQTTNPLGAGPGGAQAGQQPTSANYQQRQAYNANPGQTLSWWQGLSPADQFNALSQPGVHGALLNAGLDPNQLNQFIGSAGASNLQNAQSGMQTGAANPFSSFSGVQGANGQPGANFGGSVYDTWGASNPLAPGGQMNPGGSASGPDISSPTLGALASGAANPAAAMQAKSASPTLPNTPSAAPASSTLGSMAGSSTDIANPNAPNYSLNVGAYLNPQADYMQQQALKNLQSTYAGAGNLLSGPAMKGISDYSENMAQGNAWNPAVQTAAQQQGFGYGVNQNDQNFQFQQQLANQTIPFQQQMALAQLGLQGTQGQQNVTNLNATLQAQLAQALGQAQGTGTIGGSNALTSAISSMLQNYLSQNMLSRIPGLNPPAV